MNTEESFVKPHSLDLFCERHKKDDVRVEIFKSLRGGHVVVDPNGCGCERDAGCLFQATHPFSAQENCFLHRADEACGGNSSRLR
jgi:hypothetical protein